VQEVVSRVHFRQSFQSKKLICTWLEQMASQLDSREKHRLENDLDKKLAQSASVLDFTVYALRVWLRSALTDLSVEPRAHLVSRGLQQRRQLCVCWLAVAAAIATLRVLSAECIGAGRLAVVIALAAFCQIGRFRFSARIRSSVASNRTATWSRR
jgi:hypothetical protein